MYSSLINVEFTVLIKGEKEKNENFDAEPLIFLNNQYKAVVEA